MVSPSNSSQPKNPPLSYADSAKKAQNIKSPISHHTLAQSVSITAPANANSNPLDSSPLTSKPAQSPAEVTFTSHEPTANPASPPPTPRTIEATDAKTPHSTNRPSNDLATKALSIVAAHTAAPKGPTVNVWSLRMEQMAAAARSVPQPATQSHLPAPQSISMPPKPAFPADRQSTKFQSLKAPTDSAAKTALGPSAKTAPNGVTLPVYHDPFVVRMDIDHVRAQTVPPPIDTESWPEVGRSVPTTTTTSTEHHDSKEVGGNGSPTALEADSTPAGTSTSRKGEKTKWVPIPPEELQAAADALAKSSRSRQHSGSRKSNTRSGNLNNNATQGSGSGQGQNHHVQSTAQSRVHSRSESLQSSPRFPRGRRLPGDDPVTGVSGYGGPGISEHNSKYFPRSGASSPSLQIQPHLQPLPQPIRSADALQAPVYTNCSSTNGPGMMPGMSYPIPLYSQGPTQPSANGMAQTQYMSNQPPPIPPHAQQHFMPLPVHPLPPRPSFHHSPGRTPPLPPPASYTHQHPHQHQHPFPPYSMYPPYDYPAHSPGGQPQPYGYWNGHSSQPGSGHNSPAYPPSHPPSLYGPPFASAYPPRQQQTHQDREQRARWGPSATTNTNSSNATTSRRATEAEDSALIHPPPPELSLPVAGYRPAAAAVPSPPIISTDSAGVVFGSIASLCPSPAPLVNGSNHEEKGEDDASSTAGEGEKPFAKFSIGVAPGEIGPARVRSRAHSQSGKRSRTATEEGLAEVKEDLAGALARVKVIDLTDATKDLKDAAKWEFGTATSVHGDEPDSTLQVEVVPVSKEAKEQGKIDNTNVLPPILPSITGFDSPLRTSFASTGSSPRQLQLRLQQLSVSVPPTGGVDSGDADAFEVKDYGYGFGSGSRGSVSPPDGAQGQGPDAEHEKTNMGPEREKDRDYRYKDKRDMEVPVRPRRGGGYVGGYGGHDRGGEGRGYVRRGRGMNGFGRGFGRRGGVGGFQPPPHQRLPPFTVTPPSGHFQPMVNSMGDMTNGFYPQRPNLNLTTYIPTGFETYGPPMPAAPPSHPAPPVPVPVSPISFPLDPTRWYLLGQLEYYLSPQNMAQDFFLRRQVGHLQRHPYRLPTSYTDCILGQMDSRGWVPIALIASFNRVRQLTMDIQLVRDVLMLSSVVQVQDEWVRMASWEQFVLPDAAPSSIERGYGEPHGRIYHGEITRQGVERSVPMAEGEQEGEGDGDAEVDDDEEEDVVFVMTREEEGSTPWSLERRA
ncbi:hypothetical protein D9615_006132 [Tricholomella constricta]|uniref:HTH La-type RNA-binding domain-containing protein n=1 Tax=Tricholomella constricta TaxID=117010 RepID=A0A8H5HB68_9AGAR|nr:hypothetical protein D9615_006132 [Tricholomella constricta]